MKIIISIFLLLLVNSSYAQNLSFTEKRIVKQYTNGKFEKCLDLSKKQIDKRVKSDVIYYCYALSNYKLHADKLKSYHIDRSLRYLKFADVNNNKQLTFLTKRDSILLEELKQKAELLSQNEIDTRERLVIRRLKTMLVVFNDSSELYISYMDDLKANENIVEVVPEKNQDLTQTTLVKIKGSHQELLSYLLANNTNNLSDEFEKVLQLKLDPEQKKIFNTAIKENEVAQYENGKNNPEILKYFKETGFGKIKSDKTNWCAAFVNYCVKQNGYDYPKSLVARSWVNKGEHITEPLPGDIIVLWRGKKNGWQGHVAFFVESDEDNGLVYCYGGNQDGKVCLRAYPEEQVLAYRRVN